MKYDFDDRLSFSQGARLWTDIETLLNWPGLQAVDVQKTDVEDDRNGIDYLVTLEGGAVVTVDAKARDKGCSKYWRQGPELALEIWSVCPHQWCGQTYPKGSDKPKAGWTLTSSKHVDLILFTFDPEDCTDAFLLSFQELRVAFRRRLFEWLNQYRHATQFSGGWNSECVFVPARAVQNAIRQVQHGEIVEPAFETFFRQTQGTLFDPPEAS